MIPLHLTISGFLSYQKPVELNFTTFDLACIAGPNGAGKSSLLDAMTWALFGQARKRDDALINSRSDAANVSLVFAYEGNVYRVQRVKPRDKTQQLELQILQNSDPLAAVDGSGDWKTLTESSLRETEARIQSILRLDYETFVNAAFFLQGKADQFTQQRPGDRKRILGSILGLEVWETYRQKAARRRTKLEMEISNQEARLQDINAELAEETDRKERLKELENRLEALSRQRQVQEDALENIRKIAATLAEQRRMLDSLGRQWEVSVRRLEDLEKRAQDRRRERDQHAAFLKRAGQIEAAYAAWQAARISLENWERVAEQFREGEKRRTAPREAIQAERARLEGELRSLEAHQVQVAAGRAEAQGLRTQVEVARQAVEKADEQLERRGQLDEDLQAARERQAEARAENPRLKKEMEELKERINQLKSVDGATCPLCGGPLGPEERSALVDELTAKGREMAGRYRENQALLAESEARVRTLEGQIASLAKSEADLRSHSKRLAQLTARLDMLETQEQAWQGDGLARLEMLNRMLAGDDFAHESRQQLAKVDAELRAIGYDGAEHDKARQEELSGRATEGEMRLLEAARAAFSPLERELNDLLGQADGLRLEVESQGEEYQRASTALAVAEAEAPDLAAAEQDLFDLQEQENRCRIEVGGARQKVDVLDSLKLRRKDLESQRESLIQGVKQYRQLERAFSKDGVPALLIEQALPQIEARANEVLERLSGGHMSVRFVTQAAYKDKRREDLRETLDILISDDAGTRDYEMFSGGEAFRVNFAIRLALSEVLAQRAGARLQTLVIDEGFGSQDALGRQRLIEAINLVQPDFAKILVITHIEELKDAFPARIEVEKTLEGSRVRVV